MKKPTALYPRVQLDAAPVGAVGQAGGVLLTAAAEPVSYTHLDVYKRQPQLCAHVEPRQSHGSAPLDIDPRVKDLVDAMSARLEATRRAEDLR